MPARRKITAPLIENWGKLTEAERAAAIKNHPRWYQENVDSKKLRAAFFELMGSHLNMDDFGIVRSGTPVVTDLDGALAKCILDGYDHQPYLDRLLNVRVPAIMSFVQDQKSKQKTIDKVLNKKPKGEVRKFTIQERIAEQTRHILGHIEGEIDTFLADGCKKSKFNMKKFLVQHEVKGPQAKIMIAFFDDIIEELKLVLGRKDDQLREGYAFLTKAKQKKYYDFIVSLREETEIRMDSVKKTRKKRKKKVKTPQQQTAGVKYLEEFENLKSIDPANIIGASQAWLYNTKDRFLFVYNSAHGLSIKGSTIGDFDEDLSIKKKLREQYTERVMNDVLNGGKVKLRRVMPGIAAKEGKVTGRINKHMIILRAVK